MGAADPANLALGEAAAPAAVEADRSCHPLLLITADRPLRLKNCGANQTVNQEDVLKVVGRSFLQSPNRGLHLIEDSDVLQLAAQAWKAAHCSPGPVHLNIPFEEPLYPTKSDILAYHQVIQ